LCASTVRKHSGSLALFRIFALPAARTPTCGLRGASSTTPVNDRHLYSVHCIQSRFLLRRTVVPDEHARYPALDEAAAGAIVDATVQVAVQRLSGDLSAEETRRLRARAEQV